MKGSVTGNGAAVRSPYTSSAASPAPGGWGQCWCSSMERPAAHAVPQAQSRLGAALPQVPTGLTPKWQCYLSIFSCCRLETYHNSPRFLYSCSSIKYCHRYNPRRNPSIHQRAGDPFWQASPSATPYLVCYASYSVLVVWGPIRLGPRSWEALGQLVLWCWQCPELGPSYVWGLLQEGQRHPEVCSSLPGCHPIGGCLSGAGWGWLFPAFQQSHSLFGWVSYSISSSTTIIQ